MSVQQEAYVGIDCLKDFSSVLKKFNPKKIFLVRGKKSYQLCGAERVINDISHFVCLKPLCSNDLQVF